MLIQGASGRLYDLNRQWITLIDGLGKRVACTCWASDNLFPAIDQFWAMSLALQLEEERVWRDFPWRTIT